MYIIRGSWNMLKLYCGHHEEPVEFVLSAENASAVYTCNHREGEDICRNQISLKEYEELLGYLSDRIVKAELEGEVLHLAHTEWKTRSGLRCKVLEHTDTSICVSVCNPKKVQRK